MHVDLLTLYLLAAGTLLVSAAMTYWERRSNPKRAASLRILAAGFATLAAGCAAVLFRRSLPGMAVSVVSNLVILTGYLLVLQGVASLSGRRYRISPAALLIGMGAVWATAGLRSQEMVWSYLSSIPIAIASGMTAWELWRCEPMRPLPSRHIAVAVTGAHALVYTARASILPWLVSAYGPGVQALASNITVYEGVLYSVILPMTLIKLLREETHGQLLRESQTDYLTRLGNRRWFFEEGERVIRMEKSDGPFAVLAFDLDHFKAINDVHGHQAGDRVLKSFAEIARSVFGADAILARIGGEEFAALLWGRDAVNARVMGEAVARRFAQTISGRDDSMAIPATVSIGLARYDRAPPPLADALAAADRALYRAKSLGGNRLESAQLAAAPAAG
ncbi:GGDEF domain-containing protein [Bordetella genomosp. 9]|uniref:GGDEF domain-containing protein n=1 Tax=Bordetella genomosp. 9 TaxID=1416803 RepID=UPI000A28F927|nr:GGDEF domain-containing protein [Bordetella genomosp. 9]ARP89453.1 GGDEF domain-containing protein [Bordetella genomosp. 9]